MTAPGQWTSTSRVATSTMTDDFSVLSLSCVSAGRAAVWALLWVLVATVAVRAEDAVLTADFAVPVGRIRPLHGINKGPLAPGGLFDVIQEQKDLGVPFTRLHDCGWP